MPPPDEESRAQILALELKKMPLNFFLSSYEEHTKNKNKNETENEDMSENGNENKSSLFDWHTSNPLQPLADLNSKLSNFSFSNNSDLDKINTVVEEKKEKEKNDEERSVDEKNLLSQLLIRTQGFSGAEMVAAVQEAGMLAIDCGADVLEISHLLTAIHGITPQITPDVLDFYEKIAAGY